MLGIAANLPDAAVGLAPALQRPPDLALDDRPQAVRQLVARPRVQIDRVEHRAPDVVLVLVVGAVADPHRPRVLIAGQVLELLLLQALLAADPVHDLELGLLVVGHVGDEVEEVVGLLVEAERVQRPQHERGVADPGEAVVPVAVATRRLGQRGGARGDDRARGGVRQALERECAALQIGAPRVVGERAVLEPLLPEVARSRQPLGRLVVGLRKPVVRPAERDERLVAGSHRGPRPRTRSLEAEAQVRDQAQLERHALRPRTRLSVAGARVLPVRGEPAVVERRLAVELHLR